MVTSEHFSFYHRISETFAIFQEPLYYASPVKEHSLIYLFYVLQMEHSHTVIYAAMFQPPSYRKGNSNQTHTFFILKLSFTSYILNLALKTKLASKRGNDVKYSDCKYFSKQRFLAFLFSLRWLRAEMHNSSQHISQYVFIHLCRYYHASFEDDLVGFYPHLKMLGM